jgi:hypothetical protein
MAAMGALMLAVLSQPNRNEAKPNPANPLDMV